MLPGFSDNREQSNLAPSGSARKPSFNANGYQVAVFQLDFYTKFDFPSTPLGMKIVAIIFVLSRKVRMADKAMKLVQSAQSAKEQKQTRI